MLYLYRLLQMFLRDGCVLYMLYVRSFHRTLPPVCPNLTEERVEKTVALSFSHWVIEWIDQRSINPLSKAVLGKAFTKVKHCCCKI